MRSRNKSIERFLEFIGARVTIFPLVLLGLPIWTIQSDAEFIAATIKERHRPREVIISEMGATIATYSGKGAIIVVF